MKITSFPLLAMPFLALACLGCVTPQSWEAVRVLKDIDARGGPSELKDSTPEPTRRTVEIRVDGRTGIADLYEPNQPIGAGLVLVPGFTPHGREDRRVVDLATTLSRARFVVLVPDVQGSRDLRIRPEDAHPIADAAAHLSRDERLAGQAGVGVAAISYAVGLSVLASREPQGRDAIRFIAGVGGYYDTTAMIRFMTTGAFRERPDAPWRIARSNPVAKWIFLAGNTDALSHAADRDALSAIARRRIDDPAVPVDDLIPRLGTEGRAVYELLANTDAARVSDLLERLPGSMTQRMAQLSPSSYDLSHLAGRLILIHGSEDAMIPYTESRSLAAAVPGTELFLIDGFSHIDPHEIGILAQLQLADAIQAVLNRRQR